MVYSHGVQCVRGMMMHEMGQLGMGQHVVLEMMHDVGQLGMGQHVALEMMHETIHWVAPATIGGYPEIYPLPENTILKTS